MHPHKRWARNRSRKSHNKSGWRNLISRRFNSTSSSFNASGWGVRMESGKDQDTPGLLNPPIRLYPMTKSRSWHLLISPTQIPSPRRPSPRPGGELETLPASLPAGDGFDFDYYCVLGFVYPPALSPRVELSPFPSRFLQWENQFPLNGKKKSSRGV